MTKPIRLPGAAAALAAAMALSACGGGGGPGAPGSSQSLGVGNPGGGGPGAPGSSQSPGVGNPGGGPGAPGSSQSPRVGNPGGGGGLRGLAPSLTAGGVTASVEYTTQPALSVKKGSTVWTDNPAAAGDVQAAPTGWASETKLNAASGSETERFRAVAKIASASDEDYLAYGYWNRAPLDSLDDYKPFYYGATPYKGNVVEQAGDATYKGGATGIYRTDTSRGATAVDGRFTANVSISVNFGHDSAGTARLRFGMSGIRTLTSAGAAGPTLNDTVSGYFSAWTTRPGFTGEGLTVDSRWGGQFFGPSGGKPTGIAGWVEKLRAEVKNSTNYVVLRGVFGAKR